MPAPEGHCWLCKRYGKLTKEHIPPEQAFNEHPLLLWKVDERSSMTGELAWAEGSKRQRGLCFYSLCRDCNSKYGRLYGGAYVDLVRKVAERIGDIQEFHRFTIAEIRRPLPILKQIMLQFVTANGAGFVSANDWVAPFVRSRMNQSVPRDVHIYVFASNMRGARTSGVSAHIDLVSRRENIVAEFSFWPLGTVISWSELNDSRLSPIHQWAEYPFDYKGTVDLNLCVNPIASAYPVDFRSRSQIIRERYTDADIKPPSEAASRDLTNRAIAISGTDKKNWIFSGHPSTVRKLRPDE